MAELEYARIHMRMSRNAQNIGACMQASADLRWELSTWYCRVKTKTTVQLFVLCGFGSFGPGFRSEFQMEVVNKLRS